MSWYLEVLKKYAVFDGRARRKEYWMFLLINLVISVVLFLIDRLIGTFSYRDPMRCAPTHHSYYFGVDLGRPRNAQRMVGEPSIQLPNLRGNRAFATPKKC